MEVPGAGLGVVTTTAIKKGTFLLNYTGRMVDQHPEHEADVSHC